MRFYPVNSKYIRSQENYLNNINHRAEGLKEYIQHFRPEWKVLNEYPEQVSQDELTTRGIIQPARLIQQGKQQQSMLVFPAKLKYNEGIVNTFAGYESVWVYYGNPENTSGWLQEDGFYTIPESALPTTVDLGRHTLVANLFARDESDNLKLIFDCRGKETPEAELKLNGTVLLSTEVALAAAPPSERKIIFDPAFNPEVMYDGTLQELYPSYYIFSKFKSESYKEGNSLLDSAEYKDRKNHLLARLARGGSYYMWQFMYDNTLKKQIGVCSLEEDATDRFGIKYLLDADYRQKRFLVTKNTSEWENCEERIFNSFFINNAENVTFNIKTKQGGLWTGSNLLNHEFVLSTGNSVESVFMEEKRERSYMSIDKTAVPIYIQRVTGGELIELGLNIFLW